MFGVNIEMFENCLKDIYNRKILNNQTGITELCRRE